MGFWFGLGGARAPNPNPKPHPRRVPPAVAEHLERPPAEVWPLTESDDEGTQLEEPGAPAAAAPAAAAPSAAAGNVLGSLAVLWFALFTDFVNPISSLPSSALRGLAGTSAVLTSINVAPSRSMHWRSFCTGHKGFHQALQVDS